MHCMWGGNRILIASESCMTWKRERAKVKKPFAFAVTKEQPFYLAIRTKDKGNKGGPIFLTYETFDRFSDVPRFFNHHVLKQYY
jgi:hypothetical protein